MTRPDCSASNPTLKFGFHHENVMGTSLEIQVLAGEESQARQVKSRVLAEIERLSAVLSTYDSNSAISQWLGQDGAITRSPEILEVLTRSEAFFQSTRGAFNPRVGSAILAWKQAEHEQQLPDAETLEALGDALLKPAWRLESNHAIRLGKSTLTFDGLAKGWILDEAVRVARDCPGVQGVMINIGGDLRVNGRLEEAVRIEDPLNPTRVLEEIRLRDRALATSGGTYRFFEIHGVRYSHLLDPRTARPVSHFTSVSVLADRAADADAMATALSVMSLGEALDFCNRDPRYACLIQDQEGGVHRSADWPVSVTQWAAAGAAVPPSAATAWPGAAKFQVEFELNRVNDARYRRPYVAVWVEDKDQFPVRTLALWLQETGKGPRWHRDLRRWYSQEGLRQLVDEKPLIGSVSSASRPAGRYRLAWDGKDDQGKLVEKGKYTLYVEVAREHGTYQLMKSEITVGDRPFKVTVPGNVEVKAAVVQYSPR